jgi:hypothetical protein
MPSDTPLTDAELDRLDAYLLSEDGPPEFDTKSPKMPVFHISSQ